MKDINEAYDVLMDDNKRMLYDKDQGITNGVKPTTNEVKPTTFYIEKERVISFSIALVYILFTLIFGGSSVIYTVIYLLFPMAAIWFSDEMGAYTGPFGRYYIDTESPGCLVKVIGWILLLAFPLFFLYSKIKNL